MDKHGEQINRLVMDRLYELGLEDVKQGFGKRMEMYFSIRSTAAMKNDPERIPLFRYPMGVQYRISAEQRLLRDRRYEEEHGKATGETPGSGLCA